jgi:hypothetical protein
MWYKLIDSFNDQDDLHISIMVKIYIDDLSYQMMFMSFNINTVGAASASGISIIGVCVDQFIFFCDLFC